MLKQVIDTPGSTIGQLANALGLRQPNASAAIKALADRGLVLKAASAEDRRVTRVDPTPLGRTEHAQIAADWLQPLEAAIEGLTHDHRHALEAATGALHELRLRMGIDRETRAPR
jgi:DNA-binding MarR family transcriptional regulator